MDSGTRIEIINNTGSCLSREQQTKKNTECSLLTFPPNTSSPIIKHAAVSIIFELGITDDVIVDWSLDTDGERGVEVKIDEAVDAEGVV